MKNGMILLGCVSMFAVPVIAGDAYPNTFNWPMEHIMVSMDGGNIAAHSNTDASNRIEMRRFVGESYAGGASVLDDSYYSDQYGWVLDGIVDPGFGNSIWIEQTSVSDGLNIYEGGRRMMLEVQSYDPIFGTSDSDAAWQWSGMMTHNWYSAMDMGLYEASYRIYFGDDQGNAIAGFGEATTTLYFNAVPAPGTAGLLFSTGLIASRRKRGEQ